MKLDSFTLIIVLGLTDVLQAIALFSNYLINRKQKGVGEWALGFASVAAGFLLLLLREAIPYLFITVILANLLLIVGSLLIYVGIMKFLDSKENKWVIVSILSIFSLSFLYFTYKMNDINMRALILSVFLGMISLMSAKALFEKKTKYISSSANFLASIFLIHAFFFALRFILNATISPISSIFLASTIQTSTYLIQIADGILLTFGLITLVNQNLNSEIKEAMEHFELIFNTSPDAAIITRAIDGLILDINDGFVSLSGFTREEALQKSSLAINVWKNPADRQKVVDELQEKRYCTNLEAIFQRKNGTQIYGLLSAKLITLHGTPAIISVIRDITYRKQLEENLRQLNDQLEERVRARTLELQNTNQELEDFAYSISHDLRAPLRAIHGFSQMLAEDYQSLLGEEGIRRIDIIQKNSNKVNQLITDLLTMSKISRSKLNGEKIPMKEIIDSVLYDQLRLLDLKKTEICIGEIPDGYGDRSMIKQLWSNLIENALKYSRTKEKQVITINGTNQEKQVTYSIQDNGIGFNQAYQNKLFVAFQRLHNDPEYEGTGIGLAIVERIVRRHGGSVWAEGEEGVGATFYFSLPKE
jgi:PAS domain S-box-containing protein